jgi:hypothetical protein
MAADKSLRRFISEHGSCPFKDFFLGAADIGDQRIRRGNGTNAFDEIDYPAYWSSQYDQVAAGNRFYRIFSAQINRTHAAGTVQNRPAITANNLASEARGLQGQGQ